WPRIYYLSISIFIELITLIIRRIRYLNRQIPRPFVDLNRQIPRPFVDLNRQIPRPFVDLNRQIPRPFVDT
ncbi:MAG: hypothetical protein J6J60_07380, partial [Clostridia bacterium]|nr:hypothetical protein [Clostridia bacterium]